MAIIWPYYNPSELHTQDVDAYKAFEQSQQAQDEMNLKRQAQNQKSEEDAIRMRGTMKYQELIAGGATPEDAAAQTLGDITYKAPPGVTAEIMNIIGRKRNIPKESPDRVVGKQIWQKQADGTYLPMLPDATSNEPKLSAQFLEAQQAALFKLIHAPVPPEGETLKALQDRYDRLENLKRRSYPSLAGPESDKQLAPIVFPGADEGGMTFPTGSTAPTITSFGLGLEGPTPPVIAAPATTPASKSWGDNSMPDLIPRAPVVAPVVGSSQNAPKVGEIRRGYRYIGGDPARKESWEKV